MFSFFAPGYIKQGKAIEKQARKLLHYRRDRLPTAAISELETGTDKLVAAIKSRDRGAVEETSQKLDKLFSRHIPTPKHPGWRENCEVFLVAIVIALGVRTYFLQPFTIPTGSMQPTLNGIIGHPTSEPPPNLIVRTAQMLWFGRGYVNVVAKKDNTITDLIERKRFVFFTATDVIGERENYRISAPRDVVGRDFDVLPGTFYRAGAVVARGYVNTGDHVFVNKMAYNFRAPRRSEVFVFNTQNVATPENRLRPGGPSQFYIKRLAGVPGDELRIDPPNLYVNGELAKEEPLRRVMSKENGYRGYGNGPPTGFLSGPNDTKRLGPDEYFALGDNSFNSADSRYWGAAPEKNLMGCGAFVYWPFAAHWGFIK